MPSRILTFSLLILPFFSWGCGDDGPVGPDTSDLEIVLVRGDNQSGEPGSLLPVPLEVRLQALGDARGRENVKVRWEVVTGAGALLDERVTLTDSAGLASVRLTLGPVLGEYRVEASVRGMSTGPAEFSARAILNPELTMVPTEPVRAGDTIQLQGRNLSLSAAENVVTFSQMRGRVLAASDSELTVEVPPCLPSRYVEVRVRIGALATEGMWLEIRESDSLLRLDPGEDRLLDPSEGLACFRLPSDPGSRYLLVPYTTGTVGGAAYDFDLVGLTGQTTSALSAPAVSGQPPAPGVAAGEGSGDALQYEWDAKIRGLEGRLLEGGGGGEAVPVWRVPAPQAIPEVGERREFKVLNADYEFDKVYARVRLVTDHTIIYVDEDAPAGGFSDFDLLGLARDFDGFIQPVVTEALGAESDVDGNERVIILLTPAVNRLTAQDADGFVGGFFFGVDLMDTSGSNRGEIFYAVVPDPTGIYGPKLSRSALLYSIPAVLAHEFGHMVHFNQRMLEGQAEGQEALWLSEALAQMAEDLVGSAYERVGDPEQARQYQIGNWTRARRFLLDPAHVSVLATLPPGTLAERGAGWLLLKYLTGQDADGTLLRTLTGSRWTGVENVTRATGRTWREIVTDWAGALYLDGLSVPVRQELRFLGLNLRYVLSLVDGDFPLRPPLLGEGSFSQALSLWSSAPDYYIIKTPDEGGLAINLSGPQGRPPEPSAGLGLLIVRLY